MALIHADPERLREFVQEMTATSARLRERWDALIRDWFFEVRSTWDDDAAREAEEQLTTVNFALRRCFDALETGGQRLVAHADRLEAYLSDCSVPSRVRAPSLVETPATAQRPAGRWGPTGSTVTSRDGKALELWSFAGASPDDFDWGDEAFPGTFETQSHHENTADVYRRWVRSAAGVVEQVRQHGWDAVVGDDARQVRDVFMGSSPPRIELRGDGSKPVVETRHRVLAAVKQGATIPVLVVRIASPAAASVACSACGGGRRCRACGGSGRTVRPDFSGSFEKMVAIENRVESACPACAGTGECPQCSGSTTTQKP